MPFNVGPMRAHHRPRHRPDRARPEAPARGRAARSATGCASSRTRSAATRAATTTTTSTRRSSAPPPSSRTPFANVGPMRISRELLDDVIAHARADAPNECCGMIASRDGEAVAVHRARNAAASPLRYEIDGHGAVQDPERDRGRPGSSSARSTTRTRARTRCRRRPTSTSRFYPEALYVIVGVKGDEPTCAPGRSSTGRSPRRAGGRPLVLVCPSCATGHEDGERFCGRCGVPLVAGRARSRCRRPSAASARARSARSTPRARS